MARTERKFFVENVLKWAYEMLCYKKMQTTILPLKRAKQNEKINK